MITKMPVAQGQLHIVQQAWGRLQIDDYDYEYDYKQFLKGDFDYDYDYTKLEVADYDYDYSTIRYIMITITITHHIP